MISLIIGRKGSGKTKKLIDLCTEASASSKGDVIFIEKANTLAVRMAPHIRLVVVDEYDVVGFDALYGMLAGMCAGNYDITDIFVDSTLKICGDLSGLAAFVEKLNDLSGKVDAHFVLSVSADAGELPDDLLKTVNLL